MKIDEACIDHNVALLVGKITDDLLAEGLGDNSQDNLFRVEAIGEINGIIRLANNLKEVLQQ